MRERLILAVFVVLVAGLGLAVGVRAEPFVKMIGFDWAKLGAAERTRVTEIGGRIANTRGCVGSIAACLGQGDPTAARHAGFVARMVKRGKSEAEIADGIKARHRSAFPATTASIDLSGHPRRGPANAVVTLVEYACFQCPFCAHLAPQIEKLPERFPGQVAYVYKFFPVRSHERGVPAALAALAAHRQEKFWPLARLLFANRTALADADLARYAEQVGLDPTRLASDRADHQLMKVLERDKLEGMRLGVDGTPTFFVNGKRYEGMEDFDEILDRVSEELEIVAGRIR